MRPGHLSRIRRCSFGLMMVHQLLAQPDACHRIRHPVIGTDILANLFVELGCRRLLADPDMYTELQSRPDVCAFFRRHLSGDYITLRLHLRNDYRSASFQALKSQSTMAWRISALLLISNLRSTWRTWVLTVSMEMTSRSAILRLV